MQIRAGLRKMKNNGGQVLSTACLRHCVLFSFSIHKEIFFFMLYSHQIIDDEDFFEPTKSLPSFRDVAASFIGNISKSGTTPNAFSICAMIFNFSVFFDNLTSAITSFNGVKRSTVLDKPGDTLLAAVNCCSAMSRGMI